MFCSNCGKQIPDGTSFCSYCGARQSAAPAQPRPAASEPARQAAPRKKRRWTAFVIPVLAFFAAFALGKFVFAPSLKEPASPDLSGQTVPTAAPAEREESQSPDEWEDPQTGGESAAYEELFAGTRIIHMGVMFAQETANFAKLDQDTGAIVCRDYGYNGDQVTVYSETWYFDTTGQGEEYIQALTDAAEETAAAYSALSFASVTYSLDQNNGRFTIRYTFTGLDQPANCQALYDAGLTTDPSGLSMSGCEQQDLADGFVKK